MKGILLLPVLLIIVLTRACVNAECSTRVDDNSFVQQTLTALSLLMSRFVGGGLHFSE